MNCNHDELREMSQSDRREKLVNGEKTVDCPDCGEEFGLRQDMFGGDILLVLGTQDEQDRTDERTLTCGGCGGEQFNIKFRMEAGTDVWAECADCGRRTRALDNLPDPRKK